MTTVVSTVSSDQRHVVIVTRAIWFRSFCPNQTERGDAEGEWRGGGREGEGGGEGGGGSQLLSAYIFLSLPADVLLCAVVTLVLGPALRATPLEQRLCAKIVSLCYRQGQLWWALLIGILFHGRCQPRFPNRFFFISSGGWVNVKLMLTTLPHVCCVSNHTSTHVLCAKVHFHAMPCVVCCVLCVKLHLHVCSVCRFNSAACRKGAAMATA